jgi:hypothetical protein
MPSSCMSVAVRTVSFVRGTSTDSMPNSRHPMLGMMMVRTGGRGGLRPVGPCAFRPLLRDVLQQALQRSQRGPPAPLAAVSRRQVGAHPGWPVNCFTVCWPCVPGTHQVPGGGELGAGAQRPVAVVQAAAPGVSLVIEYQDNLRQRGTPGSR